MVGVVDIREVIEAAEEVGAVEAAGKAIGIAPIQGSFFFLGLCMNLKKKP